MWHRKILFSIILSLTAAQAIGQGYVTSAFIRDDTIVNADINSAAAIAGSKIDPDFGSQNIATTGNVAIGGTLLATGTVTLITPLGVPSGGTGASSLTDGGILLGSGTGAITALGVAANGEIPIGDGTTDPVLATITGTANQVNVSNGAGSITLSTPQSIATSSTVQFGAMGLGGARTEGFLHVIAGSAGAVTAGVSYDEIVIESNVHSGISFLVPNTQSSTIAFGDADDNDVAYIQYDHNNNRMTFNTALGRMLFLGASEINWNPDQVDVDSRWEGTASENLLKLDAGTNTVLINTGTTDNQLVRIAGSYTATSSTAGTLRVSTALTLSASSGSVELFGANGTTAFPVGSNTYTLAAQAAFYEPTITLNGNSLTTAATVYIASAPTEGSANYALLVGDGLVGIGGGVISQTVTNSSFQLTGSNQGGSGANIVLYGNAHATRPNDALFRAGSSAWMEYDSSISALGRGITPVDYYQNYFGGSFTSGGAATNASGVRISTQLTGASGDTARLSLFDINGSITTQGVGDTIGLITTAYFNEPVITNSGDTITNAATVYIADAPTEGVSNYGLLVDGGDVRFDGDFYMRGSQAVFGGSTIQNYVRYNFTGSFTSGGASSTVYGALFDGALTMANGDGSGAHIYVNPVLNTQGNSEVVTFIASVMIDEPNITVNTGDTLTNSASLYILGAATEATNNYALWVDAGETRLDGDLYVESQVSIGAGEVNYIKHRIGGNLTSGGASSVAISQNFEGSLTGASGDTGYLVGSNFNNTITTQAAAEAISLAAQVRITEPQITIGTATVTTSAALYVEGAATEATNNYAAFIDSGNVRIDEQLFIGTTGVGYSKSIFTGAFTSNGETNVAYGTHFRTSVTGAAGDTNGQAIVAILSGTVTTSGSTELIDHVSTLELSEPGITLGSGDSISDAATLRINNAPTEGGRNYALQVVAGSVRIGGAAAMDGHVHILSPATSTVGLVVEMPSSSSVDAQQWHYNGGSRASLYLDGNESYLQINSSNFGNNVAAPYSLIGRNSSSDTEGPAAACMRLTAADGTVYGLWVDATGDLRIHTSCPTGSSGTPTVADTDGTIVGSQS